MAAAGVLAPASLPLIYFLAMYTFSGYPESGHGHLLKLAEESVFGILPMSYLLSIGLGIPIVWILQKKKKLMLPHIKLAVCIAGAIAGFMIT